MTLSRQLLILMIVLLVLVFAGTFFISVQNSRGYLETQLESHAQDAATSLGLSISAHLAEQDIAMVTSMTDAIFDRGFYRMIRVQDMEGKPIVDRVLPIQLEGIPTWFTEGFPLQTPLGEATVMTGWVTGRAGACTQPPRVGLSPALAECNGYLLVVSDQCPGGAVNRYVPAAGGA